MAKIRVDDSLKEELKKFLKESDVWSKQSEFANQSIREKLQEERTKEKDLTDEELKMLKKLAKKYSD